MSECVCMSGCPFFNDRMGGLPATASLYKKTYCLGGEFDKCARYMVFKELGKSSVPADLIPTQVERAKELITSNKKSAAS
jgi:hypothetical protein